MSEALDVIKSTIEGAIKQAAEVTGLESGSKADYLIKMIIQELFRSEIRSSIGQHLNDLQYNELISFANHIAARKKGSGEGGIPPISA